MTWHPVPCPHAAHGRDLEPDGARSSPRLWRRCLLHPEAHDAAAAGMPSHDDAADMMLDAA